MSWLTGIAVYFTIWWITLFAVLPLGVKHDQDNDDQSVKGHVASAPVKHDLKKKVIINTVVAGVIWLIILGLIHSGWFDFYETADEWARQDGLIE